MKQLKVTILLVVLVSLFGVKASAHDIEVKNADEITIYYTKTNSTELAVSHSGDGPYNSNRYAGNIVIPETVTYEGITYSVTSIGYSAFENCFGLTSIIIPNSVMSIGDGAFSGCYSLTSITIPNSVTSIGDFAFYGCYGLSSILVEEKNDKYDSRNGCNAIIEKDSNKLIVGCKNSIIPNSVISIASNAFYGCFELTSIIIPSSVTSIGSAAFAYCSGLTSITIPESVTNIGNNAFEQCSGLTSISIPNSVTSIGRSAFPFCSSLTSITIPNGVTSIGYFSFYSCSSLTSITIPESVTSIGTSAFENCRKLENIYCFSMSCPTVEESSFRFLGNATLHVPANSVNQYKAHETWGKFMSVVPITDEETSIEDVSLENAKEAVIYNMNGQHILKAKKGLYIIDGRKVVIK